MSGAAEANLELGLKVNIDSMRYMMDTLRTTRPGIRVIFPSSLAVFGPALKDKVTEATIPLPQSSYGAQKQIGETLLNDYSRRGLLDGRIVRLPTIIVRPGKPSGAASSFCSGIIREPLNGEESILPVPQSLKLWVCSIRTVIKNLVIARDVPSEAFSAVAGGSRIVNLPGITVTVKEMLDALLDVGGRNARNLIKESPDRAVEQIVGSWPAEFDIARAIQLGFQGDGDLRRTLKEYLEDYA
jgi:nucleoside-diphosphate-sugar epimerase